MLYVLTALIKSIMFILFLELFLQHERKHIYDWQSISIILILVGVQLLFVPEKYQYINNLMPILIMSVLGIYLCIRYNELKKKTIMAIVMEVYVIYSLCGFMVACICGIYEFYVAKDLLVWNKVVVTLCLRAIIIAFWWHKYEWIQKHLNNLVRYIMVILGSCLLLLEQCFLMAYIEDNPSFMKVVLLIVHLTILFTAIMNLQHKYLTADNQRILDDNQRMSQEIHRSRDVIDVVSRVVATEDTIDPKLRQELADFCKSEKQEMFDPDLAASLIGDTGMDLLNALLRDKLCQCRQQEISFEVMIPEPIDTYVSDIGIGEAELLRVINDLVKNAVTAINKTDGEVREILLILAVGPSDCLELCVYDSGVPFPDFILERFGERGNTTTGTGNGLADTVNTLRTYDASIEIEAIDPGTDIYTKCVRICFDGKNEIHI